jgi:hypothetical protein
MPLSPDKPPAAPSAPDAEYSITLTMNQWALIYTLLSDLVMQINNADPEYDQEYAAFVRGTLNEITEHELPSCKTTDEETEQKKATSDN